MSATPLPLHQSVRGHGRYTLLCIHGIGDRGDSFADLAEVRCLTVCGFTGRSTFAVMADHPGQKITGLRPILQTSTNC